jgi:hypothetical protein
VCYRCGAKYGATNGKIREAPNGRIVGRSLTSAFEAMIAHRRPDLVARYNRAELWAQRREAAEAFDAWLTALVSPSGANVVQLRKVG